MTHSTVTDSAGPRGPSQYVYMGLLCSPGFLSFESLFSGKISRVEVTGSKNGNILLLALSGFFQVTPHTKPNQTDRAIVHGM